MKKKNILALVAAIPIFLIFIVYPPVQQPINKSIISKSPLEYKATVCIYKNGELIECKTNTLTDIGKEFIEDQLLNPQTENVTKYITLSNVTGDCTSTATKLANEFTYGGLGKAECTITDTGIGSWNCSHTFTATDYMESVQVAGLNWNATAEQPDMFSCATFTSVNLENGDKLTIVWSISISEA